MLQRTMVCVLMNSELIGTIIFFNVINKKIGYKNIILSLQQIFHFFVLYFYAQFLAFINIFMFNADLAMRNEGGLFKVRFLLLAPFVLIMVKSIPDSHQFLSHPKNIPSPGKFWPIQNHVPINKKQIPPPHTTQQQLHTVCQMRPFLPLVL